MAAIVAIVAIVIVLCTVHSITVGLAEDLFLLHKSVACRALNPFFVQNPMYPPNKNCRSSKAPLGLSLE